MRRLPRLLAACLLLVAVLARANSAVAQTRWSIESNASLAWWQVDPHLNHLWATTCPADPSWRPGAGGFSAGWSYNPTLALPEQGYRNVSDTVHVPVYPRYKVRHLCSQAVHGDITVRDTTTWKGVHGTITVRADELISGESWRDVAMHQVLGTSRYPEIQFTLDSLVGMTRQGDTLSGSAVGIMTVRGQAVPVIASLKAFPDSGGKRILARWHIPASDLHDLTPSLNTIGMGINTRMWNTLYMGADLVIRPEGD